MSVLRTGQTRCYDSAGREVECAGSGQDAEHLSGLPWPVERFLETSPGVVQDRLTGLSWTRDANPAEFPMIWPEALAFVQDMNRARAHGFDDWRLPNRREMRSLISHQERKPALPAGHPFRNVFLAWRWTSTTSAVDPAYAWYVHLEGGRMFYGRKDQYYLLWPVRGSSGVLPATGQTLCHDAAGRETACAGTGHDGDLRQGTPWPATRFEEAAPGVVRDRLTGLLWRRDADPTASPVAWQEALATVERLKERDGIPWRLPNINELESLVDASSSYPALPAGHPFANVREGYWSSTTSSFEFDWTFVLYLGKGAVGVGWKQAREFFVLPVAGKISVGCTESLDNAPDSK